MSVSAALADAIANASTVRLKRGGSFDAIIVGAGAAGGLAAAMLTLMGLDVLLLDAGWAVDFLAAPFAVTSSAVVRGVAKPGWYNVLPAQVLGQLRRGLKLVGKVRQPVQSRCFAWELAPQAFVDDRDSPYTTAPGQPFDWFRVRQIGGRMTVPGHGRQYFRLASQDFQPGPGRAAPWPFGADELDPWYDEVERKLGLSGGTESSPFQPDSRLARQLDLTPAEIELRRILAARWPNATPLMGRHAPPLDGVEIAAATGRLSCRRGAIVRNVEFDDAGALSGVTWFDRETRETMRADAGTVFLCASALESTRILLTSQSKHHPDGVGASSGALGRHLMDHILVSAEGVGGKLAGGPVAEQAGRSTYLPRFDLREASGLDDASGLPFGVQLYQSSIAGDRSLFRAVSFGEMKPRAENRVTLHPTRRDAFGMPVLQIDCRHSDADMQLAGRQSEAIREIADLAGVKLHRLDARPAPPGMAMHECGTARMGTSPDNSVLDANNQCWEAPGLYVTDGASFPSQGVQNPTLTIMALTARACAHAASRSKTAPLAGSEDASGSTVVRAA
jgi:choline dehydrogenase-like flavoprotein